MGEPRLDARLDEARRYLEPAWDETRARAVRRGVERRRRARRTARLVAAGAALGLALALLGLRGRGPAAPQAVRFADGSTAQPLDGESRVAAGPAGDGVVVARLERGQARFDVVKDPSRRFRVEAGGVEVEVLGTRFTVERLAAGARVTVERGRVRVRWAGGQVELGAGEGGAYPPPDEVAALFAAADAARRAGRPGDALGPLERLVAAHPRDPRAPLAAFTLGRLYEDLGRPAEAAAAFARARALDPSGPLAEDARRREAAARGRGGGP